MGVQIAESAIVDSKAKLGKNVIIGHFSIIGPDVKIGDNTVIKNNVTIVNDCTIGRDNTIYQSAVIGEKGQFLKDEKEKTRVEIGNGNIIREFTTINRGTVFGGGLTSIGNDNFIMSYSHIAHDCKIGSHITMANVATLAGHVEIRDYATIGGITPVHQFVRIGEFSMVGGMSRVNKDIVPFTLVAGNPVKVFRVNAIGLKRNGFSKERRLLIGKAFRILFTKHNNTTQALKKLETSSFKDEPDIKNIIEFIKTTKRGITK